MPDSEPEKYSIDDMMDRLKNKSSENPNDGELVTRADGSQALRKRKRKRRSSQPEKETHTRTRRARILQVSGALVLTLLAVLTVATAVVYANSAPYREALVRKIAAATGATVDLQEFRINPKTADISILALEWPEGNILKSLSTRGISGEIAPSSFFGKTMGGQDVTVAEGTLALRIPSPGEPRVYSLKTGEANHVRFNRYRIPQFHLNVTIPKGPALALSKSEASLNPQSAEGRIQLSLYRGVLAMTGWPKLQMDRALISFRGDETDIIGLRVLHETEDRGSLEVKGTVFPYQPERLSKLEVQASAFELSGITGPAMGKLFSGRIDSIPTPTSNFLAFRPATDPSLTMEVTFRSTPSESIEAQGFPFLFGLSQVFDDEWFERPSFEANATGSILREGGSIHLKELDLEAKGRMTLRGSITVKSDESLSGTLEVGLAAAMVASSKDPRLKAVFGPAEEGFCWASFDISGTATAPKDNFKELYTSAPATAPESGISDDAPGNSFEELTRPR